MISSLHALRIRRELWQEDTPEGCENQAVSLDHPCFVKSTLIGEGYRFQCRRGRCTRRRTTLAYPFPQAAPFPETPFRCSRGGRNDGAVSWSDPFWFVVPLLSFDTLFVPKKLPKFLLYGKKILGSVLSTRHAEACAGQSKGVGKEHFAHVNRLRGISVLDILRPLKYPEQSVVLHLVMMSVLSILQILSLPPPLQPQFYRPAPPTSASRLCR